jgi:ribosomal-protein-alanine N-acetyltransferase
MYTIIEITENNIDLLNNFVLNNTFSSTFRYFNKRKVDVIKNHIITVLLIENNIPIGYSHIDYDINYWFGICILDNYKNKGYGSILMNYIFNDTKIKELNNIYLTVDKININAIKLYLKFNFKIISETITYYTMIKTN